MTDPELIEALRQVELDEKRQAVKQSQEAMQSIDATVEGCGVLALVTLPAAAVAGILIVTLKLILEKQIATIEANRLEAKIRDAARRAPMNVYMPTDEFIRRYGR